MAMMHAYGKCAHCGEEGALWRKTITVRRFWLAWLLGLETQETIYVCDECDIPPPKGGNQNDSNG